MRGNMNMPPGPGRPKGLPNKVTAELRQAVTDFVVSNQNKFQGWIVRIEEEDGPLEAFKRIEALLEYCVPKLNRTEHVGKDGDAIKVQDVTEADKKILDKFIETRGTK